MAAEGKVAECASHPTTAGGAGKRREELAKTLCRRGRLVDAQQSVERVICTRRRVSPCRNGTHLCRPHPLDVTYRLIRRLRWELSDLSTRLSVIESHLEEGSPYYDQFESDLAALMREVDWLISTMEGLD